MTNLFQRGDFVLASGLNSSFKIDGDALTDEDIETIAWMINGNLWRDFGSVQGVPRGGLRLADAMRKYARPYKTDRILIVDDVWTTGDSMRKYIHENITGVGLTNEVIGAIIFARAPVKEGWVLPLLSLWT